MPQEGVGVSLKKEVPALSFKDDEELLARKGDGGGEEGVKEVTHGGSTEVSDHRACPVFGS